MRRWSATAFVGVGVAALTVGSIGLCTIGYWYAADMGWTGSGSTLVVSRAGIALAALVAVVCVLAGASAILIRRDVVAGSLGGVMLIGTAVALAIAVVVGIRAYPQVEQAVLIAHGETSWRTQLPITEVFGVRSETDRTITVEGRADRRECSWTSRSVTVDLMSGRIVEVAELPTFFSSGEEPPPPDAIDPVSYEVVQGAAPFICRS